MRKAGFVSRLAAVAAASLALGGCTTSLLDPKGQVGFAEKQILIDSVGIMLAIVIPTILAVLAFAWWFRAGNKRAKYLPHFAYSGQLELIVWAIPLLTIMLLGGVTWVSSHQLDPAQPLASKEPAMDVQVVSMDWKWLFIYPSQSIATVNELIVPAGTPIHFTLTSSTVMSAFFVPELGSMIYTMNGMADNLNLVADKPGTYRGLSSHFNGDGFSDMHFDVKAVTPAAFDQFVATAQKSDGSLDDATYKTMQKQGTWQPTIYRLGDPDLFDKIVDQRLPPGDGPEMTANADITPKHPGIVSKTEH
jgi:cytochrome o ubiquinol oxidase subunit 2